MFSIISKFIEHFYFIKVIFFGIFVLINPDLTQTIVLVLIELYCT